MPSAHISGDFSKKKSFRVLFKQTMSNITFLQHKISTKQNLEKKQILMKLQKRKRPFNQNWILLFLQLDAVNFISLYLNIRENINVRSNLDNTFQHDHKQEEESLQCCPHIINSWHDFHIPDFLFSKLFKCCNLRILKDNISLSLKKKNFVFNTEN